jgi:hypothetical protein
MPRMLWRPGRRSPDSGEPHACCAGSRKIRNLSTPTISHNKRGSLRPMHRPQLKAAADCSIFASWVRTYKLHNTPASDARGGDIKW